MRRTGVILAAFFIASVTATGQTITDAHIAAIVVTANQVDIDAGSIAAERASRTDVKAFGRQMASDHASVNKLATELARKLALTPQENPTSHTLRADGERHIASLKGLSGHAFDKAYIDREVVYHQQVLDALDKTLIPNAQNAELKALLVKVRPAFVAHLSHAKRLQSALAE